jgi:hypothetical protein
VAPGAHGGAGLVTAFQEERVEASLEQVRRRRQPDGASADDDGGERVGVSRDRHE